MTDVVDRATRSRMMSGIRGTNTNPEKHVRSLLHRSGFRFSLHRKDLPGRPDIVLPKYGAVIFVNGCFWHRHRCELFKWPKSNTEFWRNKINANAKRDERNFSALLEAGWRVLTIWECAIKGKRAMSDQQLMQKTAAWLRSRNSQRELPLISGQFK
jgi:DNA mismatch endonuclease, patch repair protein